MPSFITYLALVPDNFVELLASLDIGRQCDCGTDQGQRERMRGIHGSRGRTAAVRRDSDLLFLVGPVSGLDTGAKMGISGYARTLTTVQVVGQALRRKRATLH